jgi:hypothetical protein
MAKAKKTKPVGSGKKAAKKGRAIKAKVPVKKLKPKKPAGKKDLMCFLTTACVNYYSLPDNGYELTTLRNYRDTYLSSSNGGKKLIQEYYRVSPEIVKLADNDTNKEKVYEYIYSEIQSACVEIEKQNYLSAKKVYVNLVKTLMKKYDLGGGQK